MGGDLIKKWKNESGTWSDDFINRYDTRITFFKESEFLCKWKEINPTLILGAFHPHFHGRSWRAVLGQDERFENYAKSLGHIIGYLQEIREHYSDSNRWSLDLVDRKLFINEGHHRSTISKFLAHEEGLKKIIVPNYREISTNKKAMEVYKKVERALRPRRKLKVNPFLTSEADGTQYFETRFKIMFEGNDETYWGNPEDILIYAEKERRKWFFIDAIAERFRLKGD